MFCSTAQFHGLLSHWFLCEVQNLGKYEWNIAVQIESIGDSDQIMMMPPRIFLPKLIISHFGLCVIQAKCMAFGLVRGLWKYELN